MLNLDNKNIHFIGVGGVGVNALAKYATDAGAAVSGSDIKLSDVCKNLMENGAYLYEGVNPDAVNVADIVVYSSAVKEDNPELARARELKIPVFERHKFLGEVADLYKTVVGIAGTHGKTTTTAMLTHILKYADKKFVSMIGGNGVEFGNYVNNSGGGYDIFVAEACEYKRNFLSLNPTVAVVTNVECDHPDCYKDYESVKSAFDEYLAAAPCKIYLKTDEKKSWSIVKEHNGETEIFRGKITNDICRMFCGGVLIGSISLTGGGDYNYKNATFAIIAANALGVSIDGAIRALETFKGVCRRFECAGKIGGTQICFDFAHHPTEIACALERAGAYGKVLAIFQPHTYSRTKAYFADFVDVFGGDKNIASLAFLPTYGAREKFDGAYEINSLADAINQKYGRAAKIFGTFDQAKDFVTENAKYYDFVIFIGAGDIYDIKNMLIYDL